MNQNWTEFLLTLERVDKNTHICVTCEDETQSGNRKPIWECKQIATFVASFKVSLVIDFGLFTKIMHAISVSWHRIIFFSTNKKGGLFQPI